MSTWTWPVMRRPVLGGCPFFVDVAPFGEGWVKEGGSAQVSCMEHSTRRFGRVRPQGRARGGGEDGDGGAVVDGHGGGGLLLGRGLERRRVRGTRGQREGSRTPCLDK